MTHRTAAHREVGAGIAARFSAWATLVALTVVLCPLGPPAAAAEPGDLTLARLPHHAHGDHGSCHDGDCRRETVQRVRPDGPELDAPIAVSVRIEGAVPCVMPPASPRQADRTGGPPGAAPPLLC